MHDEVMDLVMAVINVIPRNGNFPTCGNDVSHNWEKQKNKFIKCE